MSVCQSLQLLDQIVQYGIFIFRLFLAFFVQIFLDLRYLGMLLLIPRLINLSILIFGMLTMSVATCRYTVRISLKL